MRYFLLSLYLLPNFAFANAQFDYQWIAEKNMVIGCIEKSRVQLRSDGECANQIVPDLSCAVFQTEELIRDKEICRKRLRTSTAWIKEKGTELCSEFADVEKEGKNEKMFLKFLSPNQCGYKWVTLGEDCKAGQGGKLDFHPLSQFQMNQLIPEILNLGKDEAIPPEVYAKYDSKKIGITLVYKIFKDQEEGKIPEKGKYDFRDDTEIQMAFSEKLIEPIAKNGFLNQHQILKSNGCLCPEIRANLEDKMLGLKYEPTYKKDVNSPINKARPKYAYLGMQEGEAKAVLPSQQFINSGYGNVVAVFNPDVKDRATFTPGDSLNIGAEKSNVHSFRYQSIEQVKLVNDAPGALDYLEAQIYGEIGMSDVKYFLVNCNSFPAISLDALEKLKGIGKPIYDCIVETNNSTVVRLKPGEIVFSGN